MSSPEGIFGARFLWVTVGSSALVFLAAFESLAVTTIMPVISRDLDGASLYALAFAGPLSTAVIGMVIAGNWSDRSGPVLPLYVSAALFALGLLVAGSAPDMGVFVAGRLVQGLGSGAMTVALYVVVARLYPPGLTPRIFASFAAAWIVPSLIGPFIAGLVAQLWSWHWVFLGVVGLVIVATAMLTPATRMLRLQPRETSATPWNARRIGWAVLAAAAVLVVNLSVDIGGIAAVLLPLAALIVAVVAVRPLLPRATLSARRGLPTVILLRGLASASFLGAEVYLPYLLVQQYDFSPTFAGLALTGSALAWSGTSWLQGHLGDRLRPATGMSVGMWLTLVAVVVAFATAALHLHPAVIILGWVVGGGGMGLVYPRTSVMTLGLSDQAEQGFNSSALSISDSLGAAIALALTGVVFGALTRVGETAAGGSWAFAGSFGIAVLFAIVAVGVARRVVPRPAQAVSDVQPQAG
ncbi:MFS transporter [Lacisediminihabitans sp. FW035]